MVSPLAGAQVMSMPRRTCCLLPRWSPGTPPGKTSISGWCSGEARSCARWEWRRAHCYASTATRPKHPAPGRGGLSPGNRLPVVLGSGPPSPLVLFFWRLSESTHHLYGTAGPRSKIQQRGPRVPLFFPSFYHFIRAAFPLLHLQTQTAAHHVKWLENMLLKTSPEYVTIRRKKDTATRLKGFHSGDLQSISLKTTCLPKLFKQDLLQWEPVVASLWCEPLNM